MAVTEYAVLQKEAGTEGWYLQTTKHARSGESAVRQWVEELGSEFKGGTFIAVPLRSFKEITVAVTRQTRLTFS